ncbi:MAG: hypothetical protein ACLQVG_06775 [Terriglobia bacterium]
MKNRRPIEPVRATRAVAGTPACAWSSRMCAALECGSLLPLSHQLAGGCDRSMRWATL